MIIDRKNKKIIIPYDSKLIDKIIAIVFIFLLGTACGYAWAWKALT